MIPLSPIATAASDRTGHATHSIRMMFSTEPNFSNPAYPPLFTPSPSSTVSTSDSYNTALFSAPSFSSKSSSQLSSQMSIPPQIANSMNTLPEHSATQLYNNYISTSLVSNASLVSFTNASPYQFFPNFLF